MSGFVRDGLRLLGTAWVGLCVLAFIVTSFDVARAAAQDATIAYHDPSLLPLGTRLASELRSEGYRVRIHVLETEPGCVPESETVAVPAEHSNEQAVWIQVGRSSVTPASGCALIFYASSTGWRHASVRAPTADVTRFSIKVAEALNGLRSRELVGLPDAPEPPTDSAPMPSPAEVPRTAVSLGAAASVLLDVTHPSPLLGVGILAELPIGKGWALQLENLWAVTPLRFTEERTDLTTRFSWTRLGVTARVSSAPVVVSLNASVGHALTWATADVEPPDVARADLGHSAIFSAGGTLTYPVDAPLRLLATLRASTLVPSVRLELPSGPSPPFGSVVGEGALGMLASW